MTEVVVHALIIKTIQLRAFIKANTTDEWKWYLTPSIHPCRSMCSRFITNSLNALDKYHPGWDNRKKRDSGPTKMIPASFDILKQFLAPKESHIDGYNDDSWKRNKHLERGDCGEAKLFAAMQRLNVGGFCVCRVKACDILTKTPHYGMGNDSVADLSFTRSLFNDDRNLYEKVNNELKAKSLTQQEIDFIIIHPVLGVVVVEAKNQILRRKLLEETDKQISRCKQVVIGIFKALSNFSELDFDRYFSQDIVYYAGERNLTKLKRGSNTTATSLTDETVEDETKLKDFFARQIQIKLEKFGNNLNLFSDPIFKRFIAIVVGCRPDIFISPIKCVLHWTNLIDDHEIRRIIRRENHVKPTNSISTYLKKKAELKTSLDNNALSAGDIVAKYFPNINSNVTFPGRDAARYRTIYFAQKQQNAIVDPNVRLIICGIPGSGKTLIQMLRVFIAAQDVERKDIKIVIVTAYKHYTEFYEFIQVNKHAFVREYEIQRLPTWITGPALLRREEQFDFFMDEVTPAQFTEFNNHIYHIRHVMLVLSSFRDDHHSLINSVYDSYKVITLNTYFRGTKQIAEHFLKYYATGTRQKQVVIGHNYDGIPPEIYKFEHINELIMSLKERTNRLETVENCDSKDYVIVFPSAVEMNEIVCMLQKDSSNKDYRFQLHCVARKVKVYSKILKIIIRDWEVIYHEVVKYSTDSHEYDSVKIDRLNRFEALTLIVLVAREWKLCNRHLRMRIQHLFCESVHYFNNTWKLHSTRSADTRDEFAERMHDETHRLLILHNLANGSHKWETSERNYGFVMANRAIKNAVAYFQQKVKISKKRRNKNSCSERLWQAISVKPRRQKNFLELQHLFETFTIENTWPEILDFYHLPSVQYPILILFTRTMAVRKTQTGLTPKFNYNDYISLALSRALSHVIVFEWSPTNAMNDHDVAFTRKIRSTLCKVKRKTFEDDLLHFYQKTPSVCCEYK